MKPQKLVICGWGPYKDKAEIDFAKFHNRGIFLITGATGAGKTTLFDAVSYALYGSLSGEIRDKERSSVRSDFAKPETPTFVEFEMVHAGKEYRILRNPEYMRPKKNATKGNPYTKEKENAVLYLPDGKVIEGVKEVNAYIRELMALDYSQFKQLSMIAQGEFAKLLTAPPKDKTKIFREIFGTGIYERFTANLGARAKKHYVLIAEQKNKLEEDLRLLTGSVQGMDISEAVKDRFLALTNAQYPNYEQIRLCMEELKQEADNGRAEHDKLFLNTEKKLEKKNTLLVQKREENKRVLELHGALETMETLEQLQEDYAQKENAYKRAVNAGWVEVSDVKRKQAIKRLQATDTELHELAEELAEETSAIEQLMPFWEQREVCRQFIQDMADCEKKGEVIRSLERQLKQKTIELEQGRKLFQEKEADNLAAKAAYEEALRLQKYAAIGLAAALLEEGKPCPVCGSTKHPQPASVTGEVLSEEEIEALKAAYEEREGATKACHAQVVMLQTQAEEYAKNLKTETEAENVLKQKLEDVKTPVCVAFLKMPAVMAMKQWQANSDAMQKLQTVVEEKKNRIGKLKEQREDLRMEKERTEKEFLAILQQYGFSEEQEYYQAYLSKVQRENLGREIEQYQSKVTANKELVQHLRQAIKEDKLFDLQELEEEIAELKQQKDATLKKLKLWEQFSSELKKTKRLFLEKLEKIEEQSREYGCIKELENIASGYNNKKLVFEQYVLAGYFEQILQAANIRFRKMTLGRYEMHRSKEVGDGRVKDNLEIEVMDFYTGKLRSVRTLSGGESFKASLSLALGLSDVIQAMNGGIKVETLFIDEGFGALDSESLDQACATLMGLVETERLIGIISHVPELRERIDKQIVIDKTGSGSSLKVVIN